MPTPSDSTPPLTAVEDSIAHTTCPPEIIRASAFPAASEARSADDDDDDAVEQGTMSAVVESTLHSRVNDATSLVVETTSDSSLKRRDIEEDTVMDSPSPASSSSESKEDQSSPAASQVSAVAPSSSTSSSLSSEFSNVRVCLIYVKKTKLYGC
jgi:glucose-induced degradation protein 4